MARTQTMVQLTDELVGDLEREAARRGCSRSAIIREAIVEYLERSSIDADVRRYVESYRNQAQADVDEWGDLALLSEQSSRSSLLALSLDEVDDGASW